MSKDGKGGVLVDSLCLSGDIEDEVFFSFWRCGWRVEESEVAECPCHEAEGDLLSVHPVGSSVGRVVFRPVFDESPEGFRVFFIVGGGIGTDEGVDEGEAVGFPDEFDVNMSLRPSGSSLVVVRDCFVALRAPRNDGKILGD